MREMKSRIKSAFNSFAALHRGDKAQTINEYCIALLVFLLPFPHITALQANLLGIIIILWILRSLWNKERFFTPTVLDFPILLTGISIIISTATSINLKYSLMTLKGEYLTYTLLYYIVVNNLRSERSLRLLFLAMKLCLLTISIIGIYGYYNGSMVISSPPVGARATSFFATFGRGAFYSMLLMASVLARIFHEKTSLKKKWLDLITALLGIFFILLTFTRGAWVAVIIMLLFLGVFRHRWILPIIVLLFLVCGYFMPQKVLDRATSRVIGDRLILWKSAILMIIDHPYIGIGYGNKNYGTLYPEYISVGAQDGILNNAHNLYLQIGVELGLLGVCAYLILFIAMIYHLVRLLSLRIGGIEGVFSWSIATMMSGFLSYSMVTFRYENESSLLFWVYIGIISFLYRKHFSYPKAG